MRETERNREIETERDRHKETGRDRDTETGRGVGRERERERDVTTVVPGTWPLLGNNPTKILCTGGRDRGAFGPSLGTLKSENK